MIHVYGDSYVADDDEKPSWVFNIASKLKTNYQNNAISGSSTEYSIKKFIKDVDKFLPNDIIIFCFSTVGRLSFEYINNKLPNSSCAFSNDYKTNPHFEWFRKNEDYLKWFVMERDMQLLNINVEGYHCILRSFAMSNPDKILVILTNTDHQFRDIINLDCGSNYIRPNIQLNRISSNEFLDCNTYNEFTKYTRFDCRTNHLTEENRKILSDLIVRSINLRNVDEITYEKFQSRNISVIQNAKEYRRYVDRGTIPYKIQIDSWLRRGKP